MSVGINHE